MTDHVSTHAAEEDVRNESILIYVNGRIVPKKDALVSVYDSGFMLGDGVWEGIRLYDGKWAFITNTWTGCLRPQRPSTLTSA